jgi:7-cyano-7-deazaguanine synthase
MKSVVLLSGGLDSAVCLALEDEPVEALTVDYGQRHVREIDSARQVAKHYNVPHTVIELDPVLFTGSGLTTEPVPNGVATQPDATYVPARNTVFLALAAARAEVLGAERVVIGANADDSAGYPDCRADYILAMRDVLQQGTVGHVWVSAPLLYLTKAEIQVKADELGVPAVTWSCYQGGQTPCGECGACKVAS